MPPEKLGIRLPSSEKAPETAEEIITATIIHLDNELANRRIDQATHDRLVQEVRDKYGSE